MPKAHPAWLVPLAFLAFVSLGLPDGVLGVAWPSLRQSFDQPIDRLGWLLLAGMTGYLASSAAAGTLMQQLGVGRLLVLSSLIVASSAALWALSPFWLLIVGCAWLSGLGGGAIDAGINAFAAARFSPRTITWLHACWSLGAMLGPLGMTVVLAAGAGWRAGYLLLAVTLAALGACFYATLGLWAPAAPLPEGSGLETPASLLEALRNPRVRRYALVFFLYTGTEAAAGQWAYSLLTESRAMAPTAAGLATSAYWGSLFAGRVAYGVAAAHVAPATLLRLGLSGAPLAALALCLTRSGAGASLALVALGLLLAPIFPMLIAATPARVGQRHADHAVGLQVSSATLGAGVLPAAAGVVARHAGLEALGPFLLATATLLLLVHASHRS